MQRGAKWIKMNIETYKNILEVGFLSIGNGVFGSISTHQQFEIKVDSELGVDWIYLRLVWNIKDGRKTYYNFPYTTNF